MMMKKWMILLISICAVSCTKEIVIYNQTDDDDEITYTEGKVNVFIENLEVSTKSSTWEYDEYFPSGDIYHDDSKTERGLYNCTLVSFDSDFKMEYIFKLLSPNTTVPPATDKFQVNDYGSPYTGYALGTGNTVLTTGAHYFYILCNLPYDLHTTLITKLQNGVKTLTKDEFEQQVFKLPIDSLARKFDQEGLAAHSSQRCMMTNITSPAPDYMANKDIYSGSYYPPTNDVTSYIGKVFAKVSLAYIPENETHNRLSDIYYRVVNVPNSFYLMPNIFKGQVEAPHYDKEYSDFDHYYSEYFDSKYKLPTTDPQDEDWKKATTVNTLPDEREHLYCMENGNKTALQGNSTFLLVKATYTPSAWLNKDGTTGSPSGDGTFWRIKRNGGYSPGYYNEDPVIYGTGEAVKYEQGITYYPVWLQTNGKYQVRRNGYYKVALTQVLNAGTPDIASVIDPETPLPEITTESLSTKSGSVDLTDININIKWQQGGF